MCRILIIILLIFPITSMATIFLPAAQINEFLGMPDEARQISLNADFQDLPLSGLGQRIVLTRFAWHYQEKIVYKRLYVLYQKCKNAAESRDCEKEYMVWYEARKQKDILQVRWQREYTSWKSNWLTRLSIPNLPDASSGLVDIQGEAKKEYDLYIKWRDANGYQERLDAINVIVQDEQNRLGITIGLEMSVEQETQMALPYLKQFWAQTSLAEEYMCRYLISVLGKIPVDCFSWRQNGTVGNYIANQNNDMPIVTVSLVPSRFFRLGETLEVFVSVVESDGKVLSGTSVLINSQDFPEETKEYLTDHQGFARAVLKHEEKERTEYFYTIYTRGTARTIKIPVIDVEALSVRLEAIPINGFDIFNFVEGNKQADIKVSRSEEGWVLEVTSQPDWENRDFVVDRLKSLGFTAETESSKKTSFQYVARDKDITLDILIQTVKILEWIKTVGKE